MKRSLFFIIIVGCSTVVPLPVWLLLVCIYAAFYTAYELVALALCIEIFYGFIGIPWYIVTVSGIILLLEWLKPRLFHVTG